MQSELVKFCRLGRLLYIFRVFFADLLIIDLDINVINVESSNKIRIKRRRKSGRYAYLQDSLVELGIISDPDLVADLEANAP